jgi:hypothetical protein
MPGWTKLHSRIVVSSIWQEPDHVRLLWITMLAMADADGIVEASVGGLAKVANLSPELTREALETLMGPDSDSSDETTGERILAVPGGWFIINHASYRDRRTKQQEATAERVRRCRERKKQADEVKQNVTPGNGRNAAPSSVSESESVEKKPAAKRAKPSAPRPDDVPEGVWSDWLEHRRRQRASMSQTVVDNLRAEGEKVQLRLADVMGMQVTNGWRGFQAAWVKRPRTEPPKSYPNVPGGISSSALEAARKVDEEWKRRRDS